MAQIKRDMKIVVFEEFIRPREHLWGLRMLANASAHHVSFVEHTPKLCPFLFAPKNIKVIFQFLHKIADADLVFGSPKGLLAILLKLSRFLSKGRYTVFLRPGKVTKPSGYLKDTQNSFFSALYCWFSFKFFKSVTLVADDADKIYCLACYGSLRDSLVIFPSPKLVYMSHRLNSCASQLVVLIAPTHRDKTTPAPLDRLIMNGKLAEIFGRVGMNFEYTNHPSGFNAAAHSEEVQQFNGDWSKIVGVITDYSSIGADFKLLGQDVIWFCPDHNEFFSSEGSSLFFEYDSVLTLEEGELEGKIRTMRRHSVEQFRLADYFDDLMLKLKTGHE